MTDIRKAGSFEAIFLDGWRPYLWLGAAIALIYAKSIWYDFTFLDDNLLILKNITFLRDLSNIWDAFLVKVFPNSYLAYYRPLLTISFMVDAQFTGASLLSYHVSNIIFHIAACCLLFEFLKELGYGREISFFFAMLFAVHPVLSQGIAWVPGRNDTLLAVFVLASCIALVRYLRSKKTSLYVLHLASFASALFVKETALVLVPIYLFYIYLIAKEKFFSTDQRTLIPAWALIIVLWAVMRAGAVADARNMNYYEMGRLIIGYTPAALQFLGKIFFPFRLSVFPTIPDTPLGYGVAAACVVSFLVLLTKKRRVNYMLFGAVWAALFLAPSLIRANTRLMADFLEHRVYVPLIGCIIVLCETGAIRWFERHRAALRSVGACIIVLFGAITFSHINHFKDKFAFWKNAVATSPHSSFAHLALAIAYHDSGLTDEAAAEYKACLALDPQEPGALYGMGNIYFAQGKVDEAEREFRKAIAAYPGSDNGYLALGAVYYKKGELKKAERMWNKAILLNMSNAKAYKNLAIYYYEQKDFEKAGICVRQLWRLGVDVPGDFIKAIGRE